jgi:hypothetical protein
LAGRFAVERGDALIKNLRFPIIVEAVLHLSI